MEEKEIIAFADMKLNIFENSVSTLKTVEVFFRLPQISLNL